jgi:hypothetical protein
LNYKVHLVDGVRSFPAGQEATIGTYYHRSLVTLAAAAMTHCRLTTCSATGRHNATEPLHAPHTYV